MATATGDGARVLLAGDLDVDGCERLSALLADVQSPGAVVTVDLSRAGGLSLAALRCLAAAHRRLHAGGGRLVVVHPSPDAVRSLVTSGLSRVLEVDAGRRPAGTAAAAAAAAATRREA
jgi:anti-sigma B factor antagonist